MSCPSTLSLNNNLYYLAEELHTYDIAFFTKVYKNIRNIIKNKNLSADNYKYAYINKTGSWVESKESYARAKLLLAAEWVENNVPKVIIHKKQGNTSSTEHKPSEQQKEENKVGVVIDLKISDLYDVEPAPEVLALEDDEKFTDSNGKKLDIMVRGERHHTKCYFSVKDVSKEFDMPSLYNTLMKKGENNYQESEHYKYFTTEKISSGYNKDNKELYLTFEGIVRLLYVSKSPNAKYFRTWSTEKLFTIQLGTEEQKDELASSLIGVSSRAIKDVFRTNTDKVPSVYLYIVGNAKEKLGDEYSDDMIICKYGYSDDLPRRNDEHTRTFKKEFNQDIELSCFSIIESKWLSDAETQIKHYFDPYKLKYKQYKELVVIDKKQLSQVKNFYSMIQKSFIGRYIEFTNKIAELETRIIEEKHKNELLVEKHKNELQLEQHKNGMKDKDIEILHMKLIIAEMKR